VAIIRRFAFIFFRLGRSRKGATGDLELELLVADASNMLSIKAARVIADDEHDL
jgi:hypothetical protein